MTSITNPLFVRYCHRDCFGMLFRNLHFTSSQDLFNHWDNTLKNLRLSKSITTRKSDFTFGVKWIFCRYLESNGNHRIELEDIGNIVNVECQDIVDTF